MHPSVAGRATVLLSISLLLALVACGGGGSTQSEQASAGSGASSSNATASTEAEPTPGTALTACEILTPADIEAAAHLKAGTVADGKLKEVGTVLDPAETECTYRDDAWGGVIVRLTPTDGANLFDAVTNAYDDAERIDAGDGAFWSPDTHRAFIWKGSVTAMLQVGFVSIEAPEWGGVAEKLVQAVEEKL
jgi:hypothetical protein